MFAQQPAADSVRSLRAERYWLITIVVVAGLLRLAAICWRPDSLQEDRDLYWGIARRLAAGAGFVHPELEHVTAYRPPLYPVMLALIVTCGGGIKSLAAVQIALGTATVWLVWRLGCRLQMRRRSLLAAAVVAINPLLIQATSLAMTETLFTFLVTACLLMVAEKRWRSTGLLGGLAALCRPTMFVFAGLSAIVLLMRILLLSRGIEAPQSLERSQNTGRSPSNSRSWRPWLVVSLMSGVVIAPWLIRNWLVFGQPMITTTHGGYTLLLGNNAEAYRKEVARPFGTLWDSRAWQRSLEAELQRNGIATADEVARDRWMSLQARDWIAQHPGEFLSACWLRIRRFWNIAPSGADAASQPRVVLWGVAFFFAIELTAAAVGLARFKRDQWADWFPLLMLIVSFSLLHVVYWSNLRMRAPIEPALALLAVSSMKRFFQSSGDE
jgi:4-amino-4-deoxy-L-arabinose transferase-like glycosyltransferase